MTASNHAIRIGSIARPAPAGPVRAGNGARTLLWFMLALVVAAVLLVVLGEGGQRAAGPPQVTVGTAAHHGDAA